MTSVAAPARSSSEVNVPCQQWPDSEGAEVVGVDACTEHALGSSSVDEIEASGLAGGDALDRGDGAIDLDEIPWRDTAGLLDAFLEHPQPVGIREGQRAQQHAVDNGEDRRIGADAEGHRQHDDDVKPGFRRIMRRA